MKSKKKPALGKFSRSEIPIVNKKYVLAILEDAEHMFTQWAKETRKHIRQVKSDISLSVSRRERGKK